MDARYYVSDTTHIITPALVVFQEVVAANLDKMVRIAGSPARLRPHCKTHKMKEVIQLQLERGITKCKAATFPEAEMLVSAGVRDVMLAYHLVGPNIERAARFLRAYPGIRFSAIVDHPRPLAVLGAVMDRAGCSIELFLDLDTGLHRTGIATGPEARELYHRMCTTRGVRPAGLHVYDGQNHQTDIGDRRSAVLAVWREVDGFRKQLEQDGCPVPCVVAGGSGSFPVFAGIEDRVLELSPGTCIFQDAGYGQMFPDLDFQPAALLLTRVISRPTADRVTLDLGYKAVASDPPADRRVVFPEIPDARAVLQNEEQLVIQTDRAAEFQPGDEVWAVPRHICPTSALHKQAYVVRDGKLSGHWDVVARDRWLTI